MDAAGTRGTSPYPAEKYSATIRLSDSAVVVEVHLIGADEFGMKGQRLDNRILAKATVAGELLLLISMENRMRLAVIALSFLAEGIASKADNS
jgi:hypothetical protein